MYIKRSLAYVDSYSFMVYYNLIVGVGSLCVVPSVRKKGVGLVLRGRALWLAVAAAGALLAATLCFVLAFELAEGVVIPNILMSTRGIFVVVISAVATQWGIASLDRQSKGVYVLRCVASVLIVLAIWIALGW